MGQTKRLEYLDMVKGLAIILVVLGHIEFISHPLRVWISSFHMPVFFIVSGILIRYKNEADQPLLPLIAKKARQILIPYFWFSLLYFVIDIFNVLLQVLYESCLRELLQGKRPQQKETVRYPGSGGRS